MRLAFKRIVSLSPEKSDNFWRFDAIKAFAQSWIGKASDLNLLDVGAGLGVFPNIVRSAGWTCTAIDPDERAVRHLIDIVGVAGICGDFMKLDASARYDIVTLNKVLEHVADPIAMLTRTKDWLKPNGFVYIEVPDGETARLLGPEREEFTIEHLHIFSLKSAVLMATKAGYKIQQAIRIHEPSSKYTIRLFLSKGRA
jgi:2-polyprenyl-3-methyl-5-hydroxy-6-metoxy-1,4-benzoquinol methylase